MNPYEPHFSYPGPAHVTRFEVRGPAPACADGHCRLAQAREVLGQAETMNNRLLKEKKLMDEAAALWCDSGHAFSARDPGRKRLTVTVVNTDTNEEETQMRQFCGGCEVNPAALNAPVLRSPAPGRAELAGPVT